MIDFEKLTDEELIAIWEAANEYRWHPLLGEAPENFDSLPIYKHWWQFKVKRTKMDYMLPICFIVKKLLPEKKKREHIAKLMEYTPYDKFCILIHSIDPPISSREQRIILEHFRKYQK